MNKPLFRADIEGMRAVAILLVIAAHFSLPGMAAGFIGVDIFFVISGYLITSILVREYEQTGKIQFSRFYANRFRRLFPALITVITATTVAAAYWLPATQNLAQAEAAITATFWLSNVHFTFADADYFAEETTSNLLLHTWSLGVEEQFYLLWPILICLIFARKSTRLAVIMLALIGLTSFLSSLSLTDKHPIFAYYMMPTRAWQFAAGALAWLLSQHHPLLNRAANATGILATIFLIAAMLLIDKNSSYPGWLAALPTISACLFLWCGKTRQSLPQKMLSTPAMQWIGGLSYSWYLWHWPILVLGTYLLPLHGSITNTTFAIGLSLLLAILMHKIIENPIRFGRLKQVRPLWQISLVLVLMIFAGSQLLSWKKSIQTDLSNQPDKHYLRTIIDLPIIYQDGCDDWYNSAELKPCVYGNPDSTKIAVLLGDSIGAQWFTTLTNLLDLEQWKIVVLTKSSCPIVDEPFFYQRIKREYTECSTWRNAAIEWLKLQNVTWLFMGSTASSQFTDQQWQQGTQRILDRLKSHIDEIFIIEANPTLGFHGPSCLIQTPEKCAKGTADNSAYHHVATLLKQVTTSVDNAHWIATSELVCPNNTCQATKDGMIVFRDSQHLTATFTAAAAEAFKTQIHEYGLSTDATQRP